MRWVSDAMDGVVGSGKATTALSSASSKGGADANLKAWEGWDGGLRCRVRSPLGGISIECDCSILRIIHETCATIFSVESFRISNDRTGLTRTTVFVILFIAVHAVGNLRVINGPADFDGGGWFSDLLYQPGFGFQANVVDGCVLLSA